MQNKPWIARLGTDDTLQTQVTITAGVSDVYGVAGVDATTALLMGRTSSSKLFVAKVDEASTLSAVTEFTTTAFPGALVSLPGGNYAVSADNNFGASNLFALVDGAGTIVFQKEVGGGYIEVDNLAPSGDGGLMASGRFGPDGANTAGWIARFSPTGELMWQKHYGAMGAFDALGKIGIDSVIPTATGFRVVGDRDGALLVMELDGDGLLLGAVSYQNNGHSVYSAGGFATMSGGVALGGWGSTLTAVQTAPDLTLDGCGDALIGAPVTAGAITVSDASAVVTDAAMTASSIAAFPTSPTAVTASSSPGTVTNACTN